MQLFNVMAQAHKYARELMNVSSSEDLAKMGIKTYKDALSLTLRVTHSLNKILSECVNCGENVQNMMNRRVFEILGQEYVCNIYHSSNTNRILVGETASEGFEMQFAHGLELLNSRKTPDAYLDLPINDMVQDMAKSFAFIATFRNPSTLEYITHY